MKSFCYLSLVALMCLTWSCNSDSEVTTFVELTELERADNYLNTASSRVLLGKVSFASDGTWSDAWIINKWGQVRELNMDGFMHFGMSDFLFEEQLDDMNNSSTFLHDIEDRIGLANFHKKMELQFKGLKAVAGEAYFSFHLDQTGRFSATGGDCNNGDGSGPLVAYDMSIISMNGELANTPSAASAVQWLENIDKDLR